MKVVFLVIWAVLSVLVLLLSTLYLWSEPSASSAFVLACTLYYIYCFLRLILAAYQPWGQLAHSLAADWLCLLLLPLSLLPLHSAYQIWLAHNYTVEPYRRRRLLTELGQHILSGLQDLVGYMGPVLVLGALGVAMATFLLRLYLAMRR